MPTKSLLVILLLLGVSVAIYFHGVPSLQEIQVHQQSIHQFIARDYLLAVAGFFLLCMVFINSPVPMAAVMKILSGYFFGFYIGAAYNVAATLLACLVGFWLSRYAFRSRFEQVFYARLEAIEHEIERNGLYYFLGLRIVMVVPYFLINIIAGLSRISLRDYVVSTLVGVIPASLIYANGGQQLEQIHSTAEMFDWDIIASLAAMAAASLLPTWLKRRKTAS